MNPWIVLTVAMAGIVFGIDYLFRRKKWKNNSKEEKISLLINMFSVGPYVFLSVFGMLLDIVPGNPKTGLGEVLNDVTLLMGKMYFAIAAGAVIASLILRKKEKVKTGIWVNVIAFAYMAVVLAVNSLAGKRL